MIAPADLSCASTGRQVMGFLAGLWRFGRVIWVCRVAVLGVVAGGSLLAYTVQARDLFADLGITWWEWPLFFVLVYVWAAIVRGPDGKTTDQIVDGGYFENDGLA